MSVDSLSVAVIGGGMVGRSHANGYRQAATVFEPTLPPIRLAAIADVDADRARDVAQRYGYERAVTSWQEIADDPTIDVVSVGVGNDLHREVTEGLLAAGKHVLCEKPLAGNLEDAEAMVAAAAAHPELVTGTGYCYPPEPVVPDDQGAGRRRRPRSDRRLHRALLGRLRLRPERPDDLALPGRARQRRPGRRRRTHHRPGRRTLRPHRRDLGREGRQPW